MENDKSLNPYTRHSFIHASSHRSELKIKTYLKVLHIKLK